MQCKRLFFFNVQTYIKRKEVKVNKRNKIGERKEVDLFTLWN